MPYRRYYDDEHEPSCCSEFVYLLVILLLYSFITSMFEGRYHISIDKYNLDVWDREHGLDPCCLRDNYGTIRNRDTNAIEWSKIVKDSNPFYSDWEWDNKFEN